MSRGSTGDGRESARALDRAVRRTWRDWHAITLKAKRDPASRRLVHRFRIATRRLLAVEELLSTARLGAPLREQLETAFRTAGRIRDLQICRTDLAGLEDRYPVAHLVARAARHRLPVLAQRLRHELRALKPRKIRQAVRRIRARLRAADDSPGARRMRSRALADALHRHREARRQLDRLARNLRPDTSDAALHTLRLQIKAVRYMSELVASLDAGDPGFAPAFDAWQRALGAITDLRPVLREIDRCRARREAPQAALILLRQYVLHTERRRIRSLFGPGTPAQSRVLRLRLLRTAPLRA
jgi:CHAD domain-containing protein